MIHYNTNNNAYCRAVNAETFQTIEHNPVWISILLHTRNLYSYSHFEIVICIYSVRGDIDQMSTNTSSYTICNAPNVYIFVYILIETRIAPLNMPQNWIIFFLNSLKISQESSKMSKIKLLISQLKKFFSKNILKIHTIHIPFHHAKKWDGLIVLRFS